MLEQGIQALSFSLPETGTPFIPGNYCGPIIDLFLLMALGGFGKRPWVWKWGKEVDLSNIVLIPCTQWPCGHRLMGNWCYLSLPAQLWGKLISSTEKQMEVVRLFCAVTRIGLWFWDLPRTLLTTLDGTQWHKHDISITHYAFHLEYIRCDLCFMSLI